MSPSIVSYPNNLVTTMRIDTSFNKKINKIYNLIKIILINEEEDYKVGNRILGESSESY